MISAPRRFLLLLWKNAVLLKRQSPFIIFLQVGLPSMFALLLLLTRMTITTTAYPDGREWPTFSVDTEPQNPGFTLAYSPDIPVVQRIVADVIDTMNFSSTVLGFSTESEMLSYLGDTVLSYGAWGGIHFSTQFQDNDSLPTQIKYKIRPRSEWVESFDPLEWLTSLMYPVWVEAGPRDAWNEHGGEPHYYETGFLRVQRSVDYAIIRELKSDANLSSVSGLLQRLPYPPYTDDPFVAYVLRSQLSQMILYGFLANVPFITKDIVLEKERKLKEYMKIMGVSNGLNWVSWFVKSIILILISTILMTIFFSLDAGSGAVLNHTDPTILFVFLVIYAISVICFCFALSAFFNKASTASSSAVFIFFLLYVPWYVLDSIGLETLSLPVMLGTSLTNNVAMAFGCIQITMWEGVGTGLQWSNFYKQVNIDEPLTMAHVFVMLILNSLITLSIAIYVDNIKPGEYGIPLPWYYPCTRAYWCGSSKDAGNTENDDIASMPDLSPESFEPEPTDMQAGIRIRKLHKKFKKNGETLIAVNETNLNMYEGQITALLGHNGAGKTTTMSMLTGFIPATSGTAFMSGYNVATHITQIRQNLGLCPQHDILFDTLTVSEHLHFFAELKGVPKANLQAEVDQMIELLDLVEKKDKLPKGLSGGMKRKLSMGIALIGGSKIVILDEPTSGMDPEARRQTWDILQGQREGRTILLSTHFMDEADQLGDRIAIMAEGVVKCCGTSLFLKQKYGVGYHLVMVKDENCDVSMVTNLVQGCVPDATLENNISAELSYTLPQQSSDKFEQLFTRLESAHVSLGITSFGASVTTMEEVFLKVGQEAGHGVVNQKEATNGTNGLIEGHNNLAYQNTVDEIATNELPPTKIYREEPEPVRVLDGGARYAQQFRAMFVKRVIHTMRNRLVTFCQIILPIMFTFFSIIISRSSSDGAADPEALTLDMRRFGEAGFTQNIAYVTNTSTIDNATVAALVDAFQSAVNDTMPAQYDHLIDFKYVNAMPEYASNPDLSAYIEDVGDESMEEYSQNYMMAAKFEPTVNDSDITFIGVFNNMALHMVAITLSVVDNTMLKYVVNDSYSVEVTNHPLPYSEAAGVQVAVSSAATLGFTISIQLLWGMMLLCASFVIFLVKERTTKAKHVQYVSGVHVLNYWMSTFCWDFINFLIPTIIVVIMIMAFSVDGFSAGSNCGYVFLLLVVFACAALPSTYLWSYLFTTPANAFTAVYLFNFFIGLGFLISVFIFRILNEKEIGDIVEWVGYFVSPYFGLGQGLVNIHANYYNKESCTTTDFDLTLVCSFADIIPNYTNPCCPEACGDFCAPYQDNYLAWEYPGFGPSIVFMILQCFFFFGLILVFESGVFQQCVASCTKAMYRNAQEASETTLLAEMGAMIQEDEDVAAERERIATTSVTDLNRNCSLILCELRKYYADFLAVDRLSLGIKQGECFGLLGVNGAGKTTTFKMLTGDVSMSSGDAFLCGYSIIDNIKKAQKHLGYCPQFDALIDQMTVRETLVMYARLRGVPEGQVNQVVEKTIKDVLVEDHKDKLTSTLSGGNKRKLSTGIAIIGDPAVVFLDEPTTGMDPVARRTLWDTLSGIRASGRTLVLTSHSMEECEALCTQIAIMVNGQFRCLGSPQHLKNKFSEGYTLLARVGRSEQHTVEENMSRLRRFVEENFANCKLKDSHHGYLNYQVNSQSASWAQVFGKMEGAKSEYNIEDYAVSQTTLEQVFLHLARGQREPREGGVPFKTKCANCCRVCCCCCCFQCSRRTSVNPNDQC